MHYLIDSYHGFGHMNLHVFSRSILIKSPRNFLMHDIIDTAVAAGSFKTLAAAVTAAGLVTTLKGTGPFTVFAPTDEAFAKLPAGTVEALLADIPKLVSILTYHVVAGKVMASDVMTMDGKSAATVNGGMVSISTHDGVHLNGSTKVVSTDIECTNGVIHVIDSVLLPPAA
jgi:uncharacterized surface protein with fasciclin (FAS1) repeats